MDNRDWGEQITVGAINSVNKLLSRIIAVIIILFIYSAIVLGIQYITGIKGEYIFFGIPVIFLLFVLYMTFSSISDSNNSISESEIIPTNPESFFVTKSIIYIDTTINHSEILNQLCEIIGDISRGFYTNKKKEQNIIYDLIDQLYITLMKRGRGNFDQIKGILSNINICERNMDLYESYQDEYEKRISELSEVINSNINVIDIEIIRKVYLDVLVNREIDEFPTRSGILNALCSVHLNKKIKVADIVRIAAGSELLNKSTQNRVSDEIKFLSSNLENSRFGDLLNEKSLEKMIKTEKLLSVICEKKNINASDINKFISLINDWNIYTSRSNLLAMRELYNNLRNVTNNLKKTNIMQDRIASLDILVKTIL